MAFSASNQVWLTYALTDSDVPSALCLCFSLKRVFTSRKVAVIVSCKLSSQLRNKLDQAFDFTFHLEEDRNTGELKEEEFVRLFALTLKCFAKLALLAPTMVAIKNCDDLFDAGWSQTAPGVYVSTNGPGMNIFVVRPSNQSFKTIMNELKNSNRKDVESYLKSGTANQGCVDDKYNQLLSPLHHILLENERDLSIINIVNIPFAANSGDFGVLSQMVLQLRNEIYKKHVQPLLQSADTCVEFNPQNLNYSKEPIAIVGMSCRYPGANNLEEFWSLLLNTEDAMTTAPEFRWRQDQCVKYDDKFLKMNAGFLKGQVDEFDSKFFGISPLEVSCMDPQHRLLLELVWESLEDAAIQPPSLKGSDGSVFVGTWANDFKDILIASGSNDFYRNYIGNSIGAAAARISFLLELTGPSIATESGCSSSMVAFHLACRALQNGESGLALACGVNLIFDPFDENRIPVALSPDGHCKTFDKAANGFSRAEGVGVLVLKRLSDAVRDGDRIRALVRGTAVSQEGVSKSMGTPTVHSEALAMKKALAESEVDPSLISYVETHGTGTIVGDPIEVSAIAEAYHSKSRQEPLLIGSVKTNIGHTESCAGIAGIMKVVLALQNEIIPAHLNFEELNPAIDLKAVPATIPLKAVEWRKSPGKPRFAGVSSFGITGTDAHCILEESPEIPAKLLPGLEVSKRPLEIMKISAKTEEALESMLKNYEEFISKTTIHLKDLACTANTGRSDFSQRAILIGNGKDNILENLQANKFLRGEESSENGKICFLFTGQGSQYPGMAKELYKTSLVFRMHFEYCEKILKNSYNIDITQVLWSEANSAEVNRTIYSQTSIFCVEYALLKSWESWGVTPDYALGHSLGEFAAAVCAGILSVEDALKLVAERSQLIDLLPRGKMLVIKADKRGVDILLNNFGKHLDYAAINSREQTVLAGDSEHVLEFSEYCSNAGLKCIALESSQAFHSHHMDPMLDPYRNVIKSIKMGKSVDSKCKFISSVQGKLLLGPHPIDQEYWVEHTRGKVLFLEASTRAIELGCRTFIEIGPQPVLSALTTVNNETHSQLLCLASLKRKENDWETILSSLGKLYVSGKNVDWKGFYEFGEEHKIVSLPHYPFIGKKFWPELLSTSGVSIHPLIGSVIANASSSKIFQSGLKARGGLEYAKDHCIGTNIVFPGAGYVEMALAAGFGTIEGATDSLTLPPALALKVENIVIEAPLLLEEGSTCQMQTVASFEGNHINVHIYRRSTSDAAKWEAHAYARFSALPTVEEKDTSAFGVCLFQEILSKEATDINLTDEMYEKLSSSGIIFGPTFRSLERVWRDEDKGTLLAKIKVPAGASQYVVHPVIIDAMMQSIAILHADFSNTKKALQIPIRIARFVWLGGETSRSTLDELYTYAFESKSATNNTGSTANRTAMLVDATGKVLATLTGLELVETTLKSIDCVFEQQQSILPEFWKEVWKPTPSPIEMDIDLEKATGKFYTDEFHSEFEDKFNQNFAPCISDIFLNLEKVVYLNYLRGMYQLGWKPGGESFTENSLFTELGIQPEFRQYFGFMCEVLEAEKILQSMCECNGEITWSVLNFPPSFEEAEASLSSSELSDELSQDFPSTQLFQEFGARLSGILNGSESALSILFSTEQRNYSTVAELYQDFLQVFSVLKLALPVRALLNHLSESQAGRENFKLKVLEVGSGTGSYSHYFLEAIDSLGIPYEYTYTDITAAFFSEAKIRFEKQLQSLKFEKLNIELDPIEQGFTPEYFDVVLAAEVVHATKNIAESLQNIRILMKEHGRLAIVETTRVSRVATFLFGALDGYWRFRDFELRQKYCVMEEHKWSHVLYSNGLEIEGIFGVFNSKHSLIVSQKKGHPHIPVAAKQAKKTWLLFHQTNNQISSALRAKIYNVPGRIVVNVIPGGKFEPETDNSDLFVVRKDVFADFTSLLAAVMRYDLDIEGIIYCWGLVKTATAQEEVLQPFFHLTKGLLSLNLKVNPRLAVITSGVIPFTDNDLTSFHSGTLWGYTKAMKNEHFQLNCRCIEIADERGDETRIREVFNEIWSSGREIQVAFCGTTRYVPKFQPHKPVNNALKLPPGTDSFQLVFSDTNSISDLQLGPLHLPSCLNDEHVEVKVKVSGLNFKDILSVLKPTDQFSNAVGLDFSGVVTRVGTKVTKWSTGDRVAGFNTEYTVGLPSYVQRHQLLLIRQPDHFTFCEVATIPAVYITSIVCLLQVAKIHKGEVVLIHTATGGVGLSAIEICRHIGCTIITTAGSKRKQIYLRSVGIQHVFHSRTTNFAAQILELTKGRGVDVVLNSITSEGFKGI